ncbi:nitroreductase family protein [Chloroflexota bacterium]
MEIPASKWHRVIKPRRSRRQFEPRPLESKLLGHINSICNDFRPFSDARAVFVTDNPETVFKGAIGPYGKVKNAPAFVAFIGNTESSNAQEHVGYTGESIILEAEAMNLATCWVAGFFRRKVVESLINISKNERVMAVAPIGYATKVQSIEERIMTGFGITHRRKKLSGLVTGLVESKWPQWIKLSLEAARLAPSAVNRQPWRFHIEPDSITVSVNVMKREYGISKRLCCGIAMLHIETAAFNCGIKGHWEFLKQPQGAKYAIDTKRGNSK